MLRNLKIKNKLQLMLVIPIISLLYFTVTIAIEKRQIVNEMDSLKKLSAFSVKLSSLVHGLQKERGISAGFLGSKGHKFKSGLSKNRKLTDNHTNDLKDFLTKVNISKINEKLATHLTKAINKLNSLKKIRRGVDLFTISIDDAMNYYTQINALLLDTSSHVIIVSNNTEISQLISAAVMLSQIKENAGREQAILSNTFSRNRFAKGMYNKFISLITAQKNYEKLFLYYANPKQQIHYKKISQSNFVDKVNKMRKIALDKELKFELISDLRTYGGYGGLIHDFKNYILRGKQVYIDDFNKQYKKISAIFDRYVKLKGTSKEDIKNINIIQQIFDKYNHNLIVAKKLKNQSISVKEIDSIIKIDDKPGIKAFNKLVGGGDFEIEPERWWIMATGRIDLLKDVENKITKDLENRTNKLRNNAQMIFISSTVSIGIIFLTTFLLSYFIARGITKPLDTAVNIANRLAVGDRTVKVNITSLDETGQMLKSMKHMMISIDAAEKDLEAERERLSVTLRSIGDAVIATDIKGNIVLINEVAEKLTGWSQELASGKPLTTVFNIINEHTRMPCENPVDKVLETNEIVGLINNTILVNKDGSERIIEENGAPIKDQNSNVIGVVLAFQDITEKKLAEAELHKAKEDAEEASRIKSEFLANMSHEIRTPMNGIIGMTGLTLATDLTPEQKEYLDMVKISSDALLMLINDILDFSKIESGKLELEHISFSLRNTLGDTMKTLALQANQKGLELLYHIPPEVPDSLEGDPGRLRQIIVNLVGNAIKFTSKGEILLDIKQEPSIFYDSSKSNKKKSTILHFFVKDTGIGIAPDKQELIFDSFRQADGSITRMYSGTGLGLAISKQLVEMMGGHIGVDSKLDKGSTFHFTLFFDLPKTELKTSAKTSAKLKDLPILVVGDNVTNQRILEETLAHWNMAPTMVARGNIALEVLKMAKQAKEPFTFALIDMNLPDMTGFDLSKKINENPDFNKTNIIILTTVGQRGDAAKCREFGISGYLTKPVKHSELLNTMATIFDRVLEPQKQVITKHSLREDFLHRHILLTEDNIINQKLALHLLESWGHTVVLAENGKEAVRAWENEPFDLILMDLQMPRMNGLEATMIIREKEKKEHIPIIAMTAYALKGDKERCLEAGMDAYISKPIHAEELFDIIETFSPLTKSKNNETNLKLKNKKEATKPKVLDAKKAITRIGGDVKLFKDIAKIFINNSPADLKKIESAIANGDVKALEHAAHNLKSSISTFDSEISFDLASELERKSREEDLTDTSDIYESLATEVEKLRSELSLLIEKKDDQLVK